MAAAAAAVPAANTTTTTTPANANVNVNLNANANAPAIASSSNAAQFREIHKNTWLKRLTADGKKLTVGPKKSECSWVVFCVHDDTDALLEGYAEPRQAAAHMPEWAVSLRDTLHISHALIPNSHEFEFVVTLSNEVLRFHAASWETMQEWVETLRSKLREMKILSPRENLYTKLPEVRAPLLPTRDPTSPLPAPPPVPAAIVPGVERIPAHQHQQPAAVNEQASRATAASAVNSVIEAATTVTPAPPAPAPPPTTTTAMSNTLTQHLLNMLSDPISTYSEQISETQSPTVVDDVEDATNATVTATPNDIAANINLSDDEFVSPILRNGVRVDVTSSSAQRISADQILNFEQMLQCERLIPRPQTSRSMSAGAADKTKRPQRKSPQPKVQQVAVEETQDNNITIIQVSNTNNTNPAGQPPELPPKNKIIADIFRFPEINAKAKTKTQPQNDYKSNVQIIPSNSNTIQVLSQPSSSSSSNPYTIPLKPVSNASTTLNQNASTTVSNNTTMVQVLADGEAMTSPTATTTVAVYGTCYPTTTASGQQSANKPQTPKVSKKIILSANSSGITNIRINNEQANDASVISGNVHYEKVFLSSSIPVSSSSPTAMREERPTSSHVQAQSNAIVNVESRPTTTTTTTPMPTAVNGSPALPRRGIVTASQTPSNGRVMPQLTRGLTELVISTRPSRRDFHYLKMLNTPLKTKPLQKTSGANANNNMEQNVTHTPSASSTTPGQSGNVAVNSVVESIEQRRRSSSTSDAQAPLQRGAGATVTASTQTSSQRGANNNEFVPGRTIASSAFRIQSPPQAISQSSGGNKRLTLREQQVMQLRREIMHPGGVRLNLRRKDCVGSIAWVDAFGGVWIAGWKQKEHPVLYNALHIGDQLLSIAGVSISSAAEANKIIRNTNTLFVEVLLRRIPFGRAYAIRRDREGQCLGLIRDGNTSTIVDVVPNSLAARHGLPPKTQSCDGTALTFWILTEINGRPLNLFFKDLEIRDRLNSVGRDISILVQPSDLITKLKKQLKSLRGYKDYLVQ
ncbi:flocculation protein FLO11 [Drosophila innubila]|uniref:flocculation protein FLO11 n=1 Tax=Drosophila innubila TaxID=198719 RepID=UPI00148CDB12|nr:flocculation protein FLO11 [Drosophila innubila]